MLLWFQNYVHFLFIFYFKTLHFSIISGAKTLQLWWRIWKKPKFRLWLENIRSNEIILHLLRFFEWTVRLKHNNNIYFLEYFFKTVTLKIHSKRLFILFKGASGEKFLLAAGLPGDQATLERRLTWVVAFKTQNWSHPFTFYSGTSYPLCHKCRRVEKIFNFFKKCLFKLPLEGFYSLWATRGLDALGRHLYFNWVAAFRTQTFVHPITLCSETGQSLCRRDKSIKQKP